MIYTGFASIYDALMIEAPYDSWSEYLIKSMQEYGSGGITLLDSGCGTGEISARLKKAGFDVTGIDISEEMLAVAQQKSAEEGLRIPFYQMDMRKLEGFEEPFDAILICCDSLNYLTSEEDVKEAFRQASNNLKENGLLIFDVHSPYKMEEIFKGATFAEAEEEASYIWNCFEGEAPLSVEHELTFFIQEQDGRYSRFDELHQQRTFTQQKYAEMLLEAGFETAAVHADFTMESPHPESERIFFIAKKNNPA